MSDMFNERNLSKIADWLVEEGFIQVPEEAEGHPERETLKQLLEGYTQDLAKGYRLILQALEERPGGEELKQQYAIPEDKVSTLHNPTQAAQLWEEHGVLQGILGYSGDQMAEMHKIGVSAIDAKRCGDGAAIFFYLIYLNQNIPWFWHQLGRAYQGQQELDHATYAYSVAINLEPGTLDLYLSAVRCCIEAKEYERADGILQYGINRARVDEWSHESHTLINQLEGLRKCVWQEQTKRKAA